MRHKLLESVLALCLAIFFTIAPAFGQDHSALIGKWNMTSETDGDPVHWTLVLKEADGKLMAALAAGEGETPAKEFTYERGVLRFKAPYQGQDYDIELKVSETGLDGTWTGGGGSGKTHGMKAA